MSKLRKTRFLVKHEHSIQAHSEEFNSIKREINLSRSIIIAKVILVLNIILILVDLLIYKDMRNENSAYSYLYYSHIIASVIIVIWLSVVKAFDRQIIVKSKGAHLILLNIVIYWGVFMGINSLNITGQISAYIICILSLAISTYLAPMESITLYGTSYVVFLFGLLLSPLDKTVLYSHVVNSSCVIVCSCGASILNYKYFINDFANKKTILSSKTELEEINFKLREYEKLRTDFFANISHELKTPLNVIHSAEHMIYLNLKEENYDRDKVNRYLKMIKQNSFRLIRLINNLIDLTKIDSTIFELKLSDNDIVRIVENITMSVSEYVEDKGITLVFDTEEEEKIIAFDPDKVERIVLNLLSNAVKFTNRGGEIFVNIYFRDEMAYISVKDTGIGIPEDMKNLIFDRFIQVDKSISRNREGSGIGLSLVKSLVELHGGSISVKSIPGEGSEFIVSLPDRVIGKKIDGTVLDGFNNRIDMINIEFSDIYQ